MKAPGARRRPFPGKLTCLEASNNRDTTGWRWPMEAVFVGLKENELFNDRVIPHQFFDPVGKKAPNPDHAHIPKIEVLLNNGFCQYNRNHYGFDRDWKLPQGVTAADLGTNWAHRRHLRNELDPSEHVRYDVNLNRMPEINALGPHWQRFNATDPRHGVPDLDMDDQTILTLGTFNHSMGDAYMSNMTNLEVLERVHQIEEQTGAMHQIDWDEYDMTCSTLPQNCNVFVHHQVDRPDNWNDQAFNPWFARKYALVEVPSAHTGNSHKVVISYVTEDTDLPPGFRSRFGPLFDNRPNLRKILGWGCVGRHCKAGARLLGMCSHCSGVISLLGIYAHHPNRFRSKYKKEHYIDPALPKSLRLALLAPVRDDGPQDDDIVDDAQAAQGVPNAGGVQIGQGIQNVAGAVGPQVGQGAQAVPGAVGAQAQVGQRIQNVPGAVGLQVGQGPQAVPDAAGAQAPVGQRMQNVPGPVGPQIVQGLQAVPDAAGAQAQVGQRIQNVPGAVRPQVEQGAHAVPDNEGAQAQVGERNQNVPGAVIPHVEQGAQAVPDGAGAQVVERAQDIHNAIGAQPIEGAQAVPDNVRPNVEQGQNNDDDCDLIIFLGFYYYCLY